MCFDARLVTIAKQERDQDIEMQTFSIQTVFVVDKRRCLYYSLGFPAEGWPSG